VAMEAAVEADHQVAMEAAVEVAVEDAVTFQDRQLPFKDLMEPKHTLLALHLLHAPLRAVATMLRLHPRVVLHATVTAAVIQVVNMEIRVDSVNSTRPHRSAEIQGAETLVVRNADITVVVVS